MTARYPLVIDTNGRLSELPSGDTVNGVAFLNLTDVPASYTGQSLKAVRVNVGETALEFATASAGAPGGSSGDIQYNNAGAFAGFTMSGDATLVTSTGVLTIANNAVSTAKINNGAVTLAKIANASANSVLVGSGASGSGAAYVEVTLGAGLVMTGNTLSTSGSGAPVAVSGLIAPQGRLTLVTGVPVLTSDQTAKTHVYYTPYAGASVPVFDGSNWALWVLGSDLDMALDTTNQPIEQVFDLYAWINSGVLSIGAGPAWTNTATITVTIATPAVVSWTGHGLPEGSPVIFTTSGALPTGITAGTTYYVGRSPGTNSFNISTSIANAAAGTFVATSGSQSGTHTGTNHTTLRGTGAGTTELQMLNGIWTNKNSATLKNGAGAGTSVAANKATYLGSIYPTANGQTGMSFRSAAASGGPSTPPVLGLYNAYNRVALESWARDSNGTWTPPNTGWRAADGSVRNRVTWLDGLAQSVVRATYNVTANGQTGAAAIGMGIGIDNTNTLPLIASIQVNSSQLNISSDGSFQPQLGVHYAQALDWAVGGSGMAFSGNPTSTLQTMQLLVRLEM